MTKVIRTFKLDSDIFFPPVELATPEGIVAFGGDLSPERLLNAYRKGIFPWYSEDEPIIWWSPNPRLVLFPNELKISRSMKKLINRNKFKISFDKNFSGVITGCQQPRKNQSGTWITGEMFDSYCKLYELGFAHSVEVWNKDELAGGLYGVSLGKCFFGESMFSNVPNTSKIALIFLVKNLMNFDFSILDCQVYSEHICSLGAREIPRNKFIEILNEALQYETLKGNWGDLFSKTYPKS